MTSAVSKGARGPWVTPAGPWHPCEKCGRPITEDSPVHDELCKRCRKKK